MLKRTPISILNLLGNKTQAIVSLSGVTFALVLVFMQLGFRGAVANTATVVFSRLDFDLLVRSPEYLHLYESRTVPMEWLTALRGQEGVESVRPFYLMLHRWRSPQDGNFRAISMMGMRLDMPIFDVPEIDSQVGKLSNPDAVLIDSKTRFDYGPTDGRRFGDQDIGVRVELGGQEVQIVGHFPIGTGLATNGAVLLSDVGFGKRSPFDVRRQVSLGLVRVKPGYDPAELARNLNAFIAESDPQSQFVVEVLDRQSAIAWEQRRWLSETPIGIIFQLGVVLAFIVGSAIVYMVLATDVANRLPEYATLKAIGYSNRFVAMVVLCQAWILAIAGYLVSLIVAFGLYRVTETLAGIPITMTWDRAIGISFLSLLMCTVSGVLAMRKLWAAEPASLF